MRNWIKIAEGDVSGSIAPDVGTIIEIDDPTQFNNSNGLTAGKRTYVVKSWMKAAPEPMFDLDDEKQFDAYLDYIGNNTRDSLSDLLASSARRFNDDKRLMWCVRKEAEYLGCGGKIVKIADAKVVGRIDNVSRIEELRSSAMRKVGQMLF